MNHRVHATLLVWLLSLGPFAAASPPDPVADYDLNIGLSDLRGNGATLVKVGPGDISFGPVQVFGSNRQALAVPSGAGLRLDSAALLPLDSYSIALWVSLSSTLSYAKLVDTNNLASDLGLYAQGTDLRYFTAGSTDNEAFTADTFHHVVVTRASDGSYTGYLDGRQQFRFADASNDQLTAIAADRVLHFLRDDNTTSNGEESAAQLLRIRLYDSVLSPADVAAIDPAYVFADDFEATR